MQTVSDINSNNGAGRRTSAPLVLRATPGWRAVDLRELWEYRELLWILGMRDIKVRYKQSLLGVLWAIIPPLFTMLIFNVIFVHLLRVSPQTLSNGLPYPVFSFTALVPWYLFANTLGQSTNSLVANQTLMTKVYFPRLAIPLSSIAAAVLDFAIALVILAGMLFWYRDSVHLGWGLAALPLFILLAIATALAAGLWLSALNVQYRDVRLVVPIMLQLWMYASPILYSSQNIPEQWQLVYALNPMVGVVEGFRWSLLGDVKSAPGPMVGVSIASVALLLVGGLYYFRRMEKTFADIV